MIVVAYYTNERYRLVSRHVLEPSLRDHKIPYFITNEPDCGDWFENTRLKVAILQAELQRSTADSTLYIDVDARVRKPLTALETLDDAYDVAVAYWLGNGTRPPELLTGTLLVRPRPQVKKLLEAWRMLNIERPRVLEQKNLQELLEGDFRAAVNVKRLGPEFCWIEPAMRYFHPNAEPVIEHLQMSRPMWAAKGKGE